MWRAIGTPVKNVKFGSPLEGTVVYKRFYLIKRHRRDRIIKFISRPAREHSNMTSYINQITVITRAIGFFLPTLLLNFFAEESLKDSLLH